MNSEALLNKHPLKSSCLDTPLGPMLAVANEEALFLLEFADHCMLEDELKRLEKRIKTSILPGITKPLQSIEKELKAYFEGTLREFKTSLLLLGSPFQKRAWEALLKIPYGETRSYTEQAAAIGAPSAYRAVANANGANQICIVMPCHRIINRNGQLGGYSAGLARKQWLLNHEQKYKPLP